MTERMIRRDKVIVPDHRKWVSRIVYWANDGKDWVQIAVDAGYTVDIQEISVNTTEYRLSWDGFVMAVVAKIDGEFFGYVFVEEARHWRDRVRYRVRAVFA